MTVHVVARQRGRVGGRRRQMTNGKRESARALLAGGMPPREVAHHLGVSAPTLVPLAAGGGVGERRGVTGRPRPQEGRRWPGARWRRALSALARRLAVWVGLAALASLAGRFGAQCWLVDLAAHFSVYYLLLAAFAAPVLLAAGRRGSAGLAIAVILFNAWVLQPVRPALAGAGAAPLTVLQANVQGSATTADPFAAWWARQELDADVLALLEAPPAWEPWLRARRPAYPLQGGVLRDDLACGCCRAGRAC